MTTVRELADDFNAKWLSAHLFDASYMGIPASRTTPRTPVRPAISRGAPPSRTCCSDSAARPCGVERPRFCDPGCLVGLAEQEIADLDSAASESTWSPPCRSAGRRSPRGRCSHILTDPDAASALSCPPPCQWPVDRPADRTFEERRRQGRLPVAPLVEQAITWPNRPMRPCRGSSRHHSRQPAGTGRRTAAGAEVSPPRSCPRWDGGGPIAGARRSPADRAGLSLPARRRCRLRTGDLVTHDSASTAAELRQTGLDEIERLESVIELGAALGLRTLLRYRMPFVPPQVHCPQP